ncbi:MAG TPA: DUF364 domain-containing protein [Bacteroidales bacterium]|jgi:uncharacterized protein (DUF4213/DUF364 family)|nr:hypothetical protein [Bacteroidales bacterium]HNR40810.1 DUF364 domain-containing protein [Bacteroidales bacterium]HQG76033.1 DUF364 domain-containing protein [Bacteroidales bacterium]
MSKIINQTYELILGKYRSVIESLFVSDVRIGMLLTAVRLSDGAIGTSATLTDSRPASEKAGRDFGDFSPLKIKGQNVLKILETKKESSVIMSLRMAVLSAVSSGFITPERYRIIENCDPVELLDLSPGKTITIVGAFQSYIRKISQTPNKLFVLELNEKALTPEQRQYYVPAGDFRKVLPQSDFVIITGQTLVNRTIDDLLTAVSPASKVIVTGPSGNILPDVLFENKVSMIGAIRVTDPEKLFEIAGQGGTGFHLFEYCARKICILRK